MGEPQDSSRCWSELPEDLHTKVLAWLPWECLCRYGAVCRDWNALFSSTQFITEQWAVAPPNMKQCLVMCRRWSPLHCMAYCFFTNTWKTISRSFLEEKYPLDSPRFLSSAAGLFLLKINMRTYEHIVCNPLTGTSLKLPAINDGTILSIGIMGGEGHHQATYKAVAVAKSENGQRVEIYDSSSKSWTTAGKLPPNLKASKSKFRRQMVLCENVLYCFAKAIDSERMGIMAFRIQDGTSNFMPLPQMEVGNRDRADHHLLSCGSRILIATCVLHVSGILHYIIIWESDKENKTFHQIAKIPRENMSSNRKIFFVSSFSFEGIGDLIYINYHETLEVFVYNLKENSWSRLPRCPLDDGKATRPAATTIFAFEPRPDMEAE